MAVEEATKKFQALGGVYKILSDKDARALYDESGEVNDEGDAANMDDRNWDEHWRVLFNKVTLDDIKNFEEKYKNSREDLIPNIFLISGKSCIFNFQNCDRN